LHDKQASGVRRPAREADFPENRDFNRDFCAPFMVNEPVTILIRRTECRRLLPPKQIGAAGMYVPKFPENREVNREFFETLPAKTLFEPCISSPISLVIDAPALATHEPGQDTSCYYHKSYHKVAILSMLASCLISALPAGGSGFVPSFSTDGCAPGAAASRRRWPCPADGGETSPLQVTCPAMLAG
jgi:hypothetical protein